MDATADANLISRYTDEYVDNLFSSGEIKVTLEFSGACNFMITSVGGEAVTEVPEEKVGGGVFDDGVVYEVNYSYHGTTGVKLTTANKSASYWSTITKEELKTGLGVRMSPANYSVAEATNMKVTFEDSVDPSQKLIVGITQGDNWWGSKSNYGYGTLNNDFGWNGTYAITSNANGAIYCCGDS